MKVPHVCGVFLNEENMIVYQVMKIYSYENTAYLQIQINRYNVNNDKFEDTLIAALMRVPKQ